jgi:hypothetical protein
MFVYKDTNAKVIFKHPHPGPLYVSLYRGSKLLFVSQMPIPYSATTAYGGTKVYDAFTLDYNDTQYAGNLRVEWRDQPEVNASVFKRNQIIEVVTPIAPLDYIEAALLENGASDSNPNTFTQQIIEMENTVRLIIEAYTGTKFTVESGVKYARGIQELTHLLDGAVSVEAITPPLTADLYSNYTYFNIKEAPPEDYLDGGFDGVIRVPNDYYKNVQYAVTGVWGQDVPAPVQEAALILVKEFSCNETLYRDRYVQIVSYADSRFQFNPQAFAGTGNVKADQLLEPFKRGGMILV